MHFVRALPSVIKVSFIAIDLNGKPCQVAWFLDCLAAASRGCKLMRKSGLFGRQALPAVEMHAMQHLFHRGVFQVHVLRNEHSISSYWGAHRKFVASTKSGSLVYSVKVLSSWSPCHPSRRDSYAYTQKLLLLGFFTISTNSTELLRLE